MNTLPHMHDLEDMNRVFPLLSAPEPAPNNEDWEQEDTGLRASTRAGRPDVSEE